MKLQNIKKVWEYYRGYQIHYRIRRSQYIIDAINKNIEGDFSPSQFYNPIESQVHLIVQEYIKYLLEQEALEQAQQEQTTIDTQQKSPTETQPQEQSTPTIKKTPNSPSSQGGVRQSREGDKETHPQTQQLKSHKAHNSPPIPRKGGVRQSREVVKENHRKQAKAHRAKAAHLFKGGCRLRLRGLIHTRIKKKYVSSVIMSKLKSSFCLKKMRFPRENNLPILSFCLTSTSLRQPHCELCIMNYALISPFSVRTTCPSVLMSPKNCAFSERSQKKN